MTTIPPVRFNSVQHAIDNKFIDMASIKLKDGSSLKIMLSDNKIDAFIVKKGKVLDQAGYQGKSTFIENSLVNLLNKTQKFMENGKNIFDEYYKALVKVENVK